MAKTKEIEAVYRSAVDGKNGRALEDMLSRDRAVFPELPPPLNHAYIKVKDLNEAGREVSRQEEIFPSEDIHGRTAVEIGLKFSF